MAILVTTETNMGREVMTYLSSTFIKRSKYAMIHDQGAQKSTHSNGSGKSVTWDRYTPLSTAVTPLTEATTPTETSITSAVVTATLAEYGNYIKVGKFLSKTSVDKGDEEKVSLIGQNMGETLDELCRDALYSGATARLAGGKAALTDIAATDVLNSTEVKKTVRALKVAKAIPYSDGSFLAKIGPYTTYDFQGDSTWVNAHTYKDGTELYKGEIGKIHGARFIESVNQKTESSTVTVYSNFFHGQYAFGVLDLAGYTPQLKIKTPGASDTSNPLDLFSTIGWVGTYVAKVLVATWVQNCKTGATA